MAMTARTPTTRHMSEQNRSALAALAAVVGVVAGLIGAWMAFWADAGTMSVFGWTWEVSDLADWWAPFLMIAGGIFAGVPMGFESAHDYDGPTPRWVVAMEMVITLAAIVSVVTGVILLF